MQMKHYPTIDLEATGRQIVRLRKERGLTVKDMQAYFGFDAPQAIYKWQKGLALPSVDNLYALSILLEVPMNSILVRNDDHANMYAAYEPKGSVFLLSPDYRAENHRTSLIVVGISLFQSIPIGIGGIQRRTGFLCGNTAPRGPVQYVCQ